MPEPTCFSNAQGKIIVNSLVCARLGEDGNFMNHMFTKLNSGYTINNTGGLQILTHDH